MADMTPGSHLAHEIVPFALLATLGLGLGAGIWLWVEYGSATYLARLSAFAWGCL